VVERRFKHDLREEVGDQVTAEAGVDDEIQELLRWLRR
jgi:hypothetical protein